MTPRRRLTVPRVLEKTEQSSGCRLLLTLGAALYVLGTRRPKGEYQGTRQTPGISDVIAFLPRTKGVVFWEAKASDGRLRPEQWAFRTIVLLCERAGLGIYHVVGGYDALIAFLVRLGLLVASQVPHYRLPAGGDSAGVCEAVLTGDENPGEIQALGARLGREQRARRRRRRECVTSPDISGVPAVPRSSAGQRGANSPQIPGIPKV